MKFRTELKAEKAFFQLTHTDSSLFIGSCFASEIASKFVYYGFTSLENPFGILFNPLAIAANLERAISGKLIELSTVVKRDGYYYSLLHHSCIRNKSQEALLADIKRIDEQVLTALKQANCLFLTLGTAYVYKHIETNLTVANCHKLPQSSFEKVLLPVDDICDCLAAVLLKVKEINAQLKLVVTVSPVRHTKDGLHGNNLSKASLLLAANKLEKIIPELLYLPVYEWIIDDLRDYRFFEKDLIHPNNVAVDYVWEKFSETFFNEKTLEKINELGAIQKRFAHRAHTQNEKVENPDLIEAIQAVLR